MLAVNQDWWLSSEFYMVAGGVVEGGEMASNKIGRPLCETVQISSLSGYIQCDSEVDISLSAYDSEITQVRSLMTSGFYYED